MPPHICHSLSWDRRRGVNPGARQRRRADRAVDGAKANAKLQTSIDDNDEILVCSRSNLVAGRWSQMTRNVGDDNLGVGVKDVMRSPRSVGQRATLNEKAVDARRFDSRRDAPREFRGRRVNFEGARPRWRQCGSVEIGARCCRDRRCNDAAVAEKRRARDTTHATRIDERRRSRAYSRPAFRGHVARALANAEPRRWRSHSSPRRCLIQMPGKVRLGARVGTLKLRLAVDAQPRRLAVTVALGHVAVGSLLGRRLIDRDSRSSDANKLDDGARNVQRILRLALVTAGVRSTERVDVQQRDAVLCRLLDRLATAAAAATAAAIVIIAAATAAAAAAAAVEAPPSSRGARRRKAQTRQSQRRSFNDENSTRKK